MIVKFRIEESMSPVAGRLIYSEDEYAFTTEPRPEGCATSVSINELELMLDEVNERVVFVTGYCPHTGWQPSVLTPPAVRRLGQLHVMFDKDVVPGTSISLHPQNERWPVLVDRNNGWVRLGKADPRKDREAVKIAPGAVVVLEGERLVAIWLHPEIEESTSKSKSR